MFFTRFCIALLLAHVAISLGAQDFDNYQPLQIQGTLNKDFTGDLYAQLDQAKTKDRSGRRRERKSRREFEYESSYVTAQLMQSGEILSGDPLTAYVNEVADIILAGDSRLRNKLRFYVARNPVPNAFALPNGVIIINTGLLARLNTEAELAFILCHETVHFTEKHSIEEFLVNEQLERESRGTLFKQGSDRYDNLLKSKKYSRDQEIEADEDGFELFKSTPYASHYADSALQMLVYSNVPWANEQFVLASFNAEGYFTIPDDAILATPNPVTGIDEDSDDSESTHPNIGRRRYLIQEALEARVSDEGKAFVLPESRLREVVKIARYELPYLYLNSGEFLRAFYAAYLLEQVYEPGNYTRDMKAKALYAKARYHNEEGEGDLDDTQGEMHKLRYAYDEFGYEEEVILGVRELWKAYLATDEDIYRDMALELVHRLVFIEQRTWSLYSAEDERGVKMARYGNNNRSSDDDYETDVSYSPQYLGMALNDLTRKEELKEQFERSNRVYEEVDAYTTTERESYFEDRAIVKNNKLLIYNPIALGADYYYLRRVELDYEDMRQASDRLNKALDIAFRKTKLKRKDLSTNKLGKRNVEALNHAFVLNNYLSQVLNTDYSGMVAFDKARIDEIIETYGTEYMAMVGFVDTDIVSTSTLVFSKVFTGAMYVAINPLAVTSGFFARDKNFDLVMLVVNLRTGEVIYSNSASASHPNGAYQANIKNQLYYMFRDISK